MVALIAYLAIGALVVISISIVRRQTPGDPDPIRDALASLVPERGSPVRRMIVGTVAPAVATIVSGSSRGRSRSGCARRGQRAARPRSRAAGPGPGGRARSPAGANERPRSRAPGAHQRPAARGSGRSIRVPPPRVAPLRRTTRRRRRAVVVLGALARRVDGRTAPGVPILRGGEVRAYFVSSRGTPGTGARGQ